MILPEPHPDTLLNQQLTRQVTRGGKQAIETAAMNAMWEALEEGKGREEAEKIFFSFFNKQNHGNGREN